jgi:hypothetical protein
MPVILENGSEEITTWLDPNRTTWSKELQCLLKPFKGELEVYPVSKDVGKVGNNSESFIIPLSSSQNKSNIANFFSKGTAKGESKSAIGTNPATLTKASDKMNGKESTSIKFEHTEEHSAIGHTATNDDPSSPITKFNAKHGIKRELEDETAEQTSAKFLKTSASPSKASSSPKIKMRSATSNNTASPKKSTSKEKGSQKITSFFGK